MAESIAPQAKKAKGSAPLTRTTAEEWARQFKNDLYAEEECSFAVFVNTALILRESTVKDHLKSKKKQRAVLLRVLQPAGKMCILADIPLEKTDKIRQFLEKHCKQVGALPKVHVPTLRTTYVPKLFSSVKLSCLYNQIFCCV